jgi:hypothetical protein
MAAEVAIEGKTPKLLSILSAKRTFELFGADAGGLPSLDADRCAVDEQQPPPLPLQHESSPGLRHIA